MSLTREYNEVIKDGIASFFSVQQYKSILDFSLQDVDLSADVSAEKSKVDLDNYPYLIQPLKSLAIEAGKRKEVVISFPQQMGKSLLMMLCCLYNVTYNELQALITFPSLDLAVETSTTKFIPIFKNIPQFKEEIEKPFAIRGDRLKLSNALIYWISAGGARISSRSAKLVIGDEVAIWDAPNGTNQITELKKRTRSYNESLALFVSTPTYKENPFWREFLQCSQGFYFLRCPHCRKLTFRSADVFNLQFQSVYDQELKQYVVVRGTERLICPQCRFEADQSYREGMIKEGGYVHRYEDRRELTPSFQCGVLASLLNVHAWSTIADLTLAQGRGAELTDFMSYDNSIRGLPYIERNHNKQDETALSKHYYKQNELKKEEIEAIYIVADTQDTFSVLAVLAYTIHDNIFVLEMARPRYLFLEENERKIINEENHRNGKENEKTVLDYINSEYYGIKPICAMLDYRGHRSEEIKNFSKMQKNILMYAGSSLKYQRWKISENNPKLFLCDSRKFQAELIFKLYAQNNKECNFLFLPQTISEKDVNEILSFQPDSTKRNGNLYENYTAGDRIHDMFDTLKMGIACIAISAKIYKKQRFLHGKASLVTKTRQNVSKRPQKANKAIIRKPIFPSY